MFGSSKPRLFRGLEMLFSPHEETGMVGTRGYQLFDRADHDDGTPTARVPSPSEVLWAPQAGGQLLGITCPVFDCLITGTRGSGKTEVLLMDFLARVGRGWGHHWRGVLFRRTYRQLDDLIHRAHQWMHAFPGSKYNHSSNTWTFADGEQLLFRYFHDMRDYWEYHGHQFPWVAFEELTTWASLDGPQAMQSCIRSPVPGIPLRFRGTTNPMGVGHSIVKAHYRIGDVPPGTILTDAEGNQRTYIRTYWFENLALIQSDTAYATRLRAIGDPALRAAWYEGDWAGSFGDMFGHLMGPEQLNRIVFDDIVVPNDVTLYPSIDWGTAAPFSIGLTVKSDGRTFHSRDGRTQYQFPVGSFLRVWEWVGCASKERLNTGIRWDASEVAAKMRTRLTEEFPKNKIGVAVADPAMWGVIGHGTTIANEFMAQGIALEPAVTGPGSRTAGWQVMSRLLRNAGDPQSNLPGLYLAASCWYSLATWPTMPRHANNPEDVDTTGPDHSLDEMRYRVTTIPSTATAGFWRV